MARDAQLRLFDHGPRHMSLPNGHPDAEIQYLVSKHTWYSFYRSQSVKRSSELKSRGETRPAVWQHNALTTKLSDVSCNVYSH